MAKKLYVTVSDSVYSDLENFISHCDVVFPNVSKSFAVNLFLDRSLDVFRRGLSNGFSWDEMISSYFKAVELRKFNDFMESI